MGSDSDIDSGCAPQPGPPAPLPFGAADLAQCLGWGWHRFRQIPGASTAYATPFALIGLGLLLGLRWLGLTAFMPVLLGGFMLVGPALLAGFFRLASAGDRPALRSAWAATLRAPPGLWVISLVCGVLFLVWVTDAAVLYGFIVGSGPPAALPGWLPRLPANVLRFELWAALLGIGLAAMIFVASAFSVPLLHERRATLVPAVHASARAVFTSPLAAVLWALLLASGTGLGILLLPLFPMVLPVLAYASYALYRRVFP